MIKQLVFTDNGVGAYARAKEMIKKADIYNPTTAEQMKYSLDKCLMSLLHLIVNSKECKECRIGSTYQDGGFSFEVMNHKEIILKQGKILLIAKNEDVDRPSEWQIVNA